MSQQSHRFSVSAQQRCRAAMVGGGRLALETLALITQDPETEVMSLWDPDRSALVFRLEDLGFTFTDSIKPKLLRDFREMVALPAPDLIVDASSNSEIRHGLDVFLDRGSRILSARTAQFLWGLKLSRESVLNQALEKLPVLLEEIDLLRNETEFFEVLLQTSLILTKARSATLYLQRSAEEGPVPVHATARLSGMDGKSLLGITWPDSGVARLVARLKQPFRIPDENYPGTDDPKGNPKESILALPILADLSGANEVGGVIQVYKDSASGMFTQEELKACSQLCQACVGHLKKFLHLQEMREISVIETMRMEINSILNSTSTLQEKLSRATEKFHDVLGGCDAHFYILEQSSGDLVLQASTNQASHVCGMLRVRKGEGFVGQAAQLRQPLFLKGGFSGHPVRWKEQGLFYLPLSASGSVWGVLCVERLPVGLGTERILKLVEETGESFARAIAEDLERHRMSQKLLRLSVVQEEGLELLSITDRERLMTTLSASAAMLVDAEAVIVRVYEKKGRRLLVGSTYGLQKNDMDTKLVQLDGLIALKVFQSRGHQVLDDLRKYDSSLPPKFPYLHGLCRTLEYEGVAVGTLSVYNKLAFQSFGCTAFDQDDAEILEKYSYYAGKAIINAQEAEARSILITIDELTGLRNERYLLQRLPEEIQRAERYKRSLSLMIFEVQREGRDQTPETTHTEKEFIRRISEVLQETFRNVDILVRLKGTRFAILMPDTGETVTDAAMRLTHGLASLPLKVFIGYATYPKEANTAQDLLKKASRLSAMVKES